MTNCAVRPTALMASDEKRIGEHRAEQRAHEDRDAGQVDVGEVPVRRQDLAGIGEAMRDDIVHALEVGGEEQEGGERGGADGVALGERLGGVAGGVQLVGLLARRRPAGWTSR